MSKIETELNRMQLVFKEKNKKPIFFIGSGLSRRYLDTPDWNGLLESIAEDVQCNYDKISENCDKENEKIAQELEYFCFRSADKENVELNNRRKIFREHIAKKFEDYCESFKKNFYEGKQQYLLNNTEFNKSINERLNSIASEGYTENQYAETYKEIAEDVYKHSERYIKSKEIHEFQRINPQAIITTNYDVLLEDIIFPNRLERHIGQEGFKGKIEEKEEKIDLYKIHGCITKPESIIITKEDYDDFFQRSKYLYSKLLTMFWEYPVIFIGYSISDRNIKDILTVMIEVMTEEQKNEFLEHIWVVDYVKDEQEQKVEYKEVELLNGKSIKVTCFQLKNYDKFFKTVSHVVLSQNFGELKFTISDNVIELLIKPLYQQQDKLKVVTRELLQNALDACKKKGAPAKIDIKIFEEDRKKFLEIRDNGIGMNLQEIRENFLTVGKTNKRDNQQGMVGKYGIGILSIFLIGDYAEVYTKKEDNEILSLRLYITNDKKQVSWLDSDFELKANVFEKSFTIIKIQLSDNINVESNIKIEDYLKMLGLETYISKPVNQITVECMEKSAEISRLDKVEWFQDLQNGFKLYKAEWLVLGELSDSEKKLKSILDNKNTIFYNDMISAVEYNKNGFIQLKGINIPFVMIDVMNVNKVETEIKTDLSRSKIQISGETMKMIASGIYNLEVDKMISMLTDFLKEENREYKFNAFYAMRQLKSECIILGKNVDILLKENKLLFSGRYNLPHIEIWGNRIGADAIIKNIKEPVLYCESNMHKGSVADMIIGDKLICISISYLDEYIYRATSPQNGLRKEALVKILKRIGVEGIDLNNSSIDIWNYIKANRHIIKTLYTNKAVNNILWIDECYKIETEVNMGVLIMFKTSLVENYLDGVFIEILKKKIDKEVLNDIVQICD